MSKIPLLVKLILLFSLLLLIVTAVPPAQTDAVCSPPVNASVKIDNSGLLSTGGSGSQFEFISTPSADTHSICGPQAVVEEFNDLNYQKIKALYYDKANSSITKQELTGDQTETVLNSDTPPTSLYHIKDGNLTVGANITVNRIKVIFVDKDLWIKQNLTHTNGLAGLVFVVGGNIWVDETVAEIDALIIVHNQFCSAATGFDINTLSCRPDGFQTTSQLTIYGSLIFMNNPYSNTDPPIPSLTPFQPNFVRSYNSNVQPAETVAYQPKYLVLLKNFFAKPKTIWTELQ